MKRAKGIRVPNSDNGNTPPGGPPPEARPEARMEASALRMLRARAHLRAELRRKLRRRDHPAGPVDALLDHFADLGYLDDARAARSWIRHRREARPMGRRLLARELRGRGTPAEILARALEADYPAEEEPAAARAAAEKHLRRRGGPGDPRARERLFRFLRSRGFPLSLCAETVRALCGEGAEEEELPPPFEPPEPEES